MTTPREQYADLHLRKQALQADLKKITTEMTALEEPLLEGMLAEDMTTCRVRDVTLYIQRQLWAVPAKGVERQEVAEALRSSAMAEHINFNQQSLSSWLREIARDATGKDNPSKEEAEAALGPSGLHGIIAVDEQVKIRARRSQ